MDAIKILIQFLRYALPLVPGLKDVAKDFWGANNLGPMPPDLDAWAEIDKRIDRERATQKGNE